jgi:hypothetical protein
MRFVLFFLDLNVFKFEFELQSSGADSQYNLSPPSPPTPAIFIFEPLRKKALLHGSIISVRALSAQFPRHPIYLE